VGIGSLFNGLSQLGAASETLPEPIAQTAISIRQLDNALSNVNPTAGATIAAASTDIAKRIKDGAKNIADAGKKWASSLDITAGLNEDKTAFDASAFMEKMRAVVAAAKALPAKLRALRKAGASPEVLQQIVAMGPQEGLVAATGFLDNAGSVKEYSTSLQTLNKLGAQSQANAAGANTYAININKANMTAEEIIAAIQKYERKTGKKVNWGG
jgi:hypothetical protein